MSKDNGDMEMSQDRVGVSVTVVRAQAAKCVAHERCVRSNRTRPQVAMFERMLQAPARGASMRALSRQARARMAAEPTHGAISWVSSVTDTLGLSREAMTGRASSQRLQWVRQRRPTHRIEANVQGMANG